MNKKQQNSFGRWLSFVLRHKPEEVAKHLNKQSVIDAEGYISIQDLIDAYKVESGLEGSLEDLKAIVANDNKGRYSFNRIFTSLRANQGHSTKAVNVTHKEATPPELYHGTADRFLDAIFKDDDGGLKKMSRHHVHLSDNLETASQVGTRHGKLVVLSVDTTQMVADGYKFYLSDNGVWLTDNVPTKYLSKLDFY